MMRDEPGLNFKTEMLRMPIRLPHFSKGNQLYVYNEYDFIKKRVTVKQGPRMLTD